MNQIDFLFGVIFGVMLTVFCVELNFITTILFKEKEEINRGERR